MEDFEERLEELNSECKEAADKRNKLLIAQQGGDDSISQDDVFNALLDCEEVKIKFSKLERATGKEINFPDIEQTPETIYAALHSVVYEYEDKENFVNELRKRPVDLMYVNFFNIVIRELSTMTNRGIEIFMTDSDSEKKKLSFNQENISNYINWMNCIVDRPAVILSELGKLDDVDFSLELGAYQKGVDAFEQGKINISLTPSAKVLKSMQEDPAGTESFDVEIAVSPEEFQVFIDKTEEFSSILKTHFRYIGSIHASKVIDSLEYRKTDNGLVGVITHPPLKHKDNHDDEKTPGVE